MSTGPGFTRPTSSSSSRVIGASDTEGQDCARVRPPAETPKRPSRTLGRPSTPVRRPSTPTKPLDQSSGIPIPRAGTRKYTLTRKSSSSSLVGISSPSKFILPPRPSSPAVTNRVSASGHIASSPDSILDDSVLHAEPEIMATITSTVTDKDKTRTVSRKSTKLAQGRDEADKEAPKPEPIGAPQQAANDPALPSQPNKNEAEAKIVEPKTSNETPIAQAAPKPEKPKAGQGPGLAPGAGEPAGESPQDLNQNTATQAVENSTGNSTQRPEPAGNTESKPITQKDVLTPEAQSNANPDKKPDTPGNSSSQAPASNPTETSTHPGDGAPKNPTPLGTVTPPTTTTPAPATPGLPSAPTVPGGLSLPSPIQLLATPIALALNKPGTDVGRINAVWNKWFNALAGSDYVEPAAHRYDINDELVPDIVVYSLPGPGRSPEWKIVYGGQPGVDSLPPGKPSEANWEDARQRMEYVCAQHKDQSPKWAVLAIGSWARIFKFNGGKLVGQMWMGAKLVPRAPYEPDPDVDKSICININIGVSVPPFPYDVVLQQAFTTMLSNVPI
ncbi:hypothetical protein FS749_015918 [Ceratobasidium sp. UAMH 11750]|nr:hypothetical protein FS749_015918 [Ceratobasidium sp. UAMH 11750]